MEWINVKDGYPPINVRVLVYQAGGVYGGYEIDIEYRCDDRFWNDQGLVSEITHWMPLPEPPEDNA